MNSKNAFQRLREDTSWNKIGKFGHFLTLFGDMQNGWKKGVRSPKDQSSATPAPCTRGDHSDHLALSCLPCEGSIGSATFVFIHVLAGEIAIDRSMAGPRQIASQRSARVLSFERTRPVFKKRSRLLVTSLKVEKRDGLGFKV